MSRRLSFVVALTLVLALTAPGLVAQAVEPLPSSMASLGDSITRAYNTGPSSFQDYPASSWSTGTTATVNSHYLRMGAQKPAIARVFNDAASGAKMAGLRAQVNVANTQNVDYVTILMGGNDICTKTEGEMTAPATFEGQFRDALGALQTGSPNAKVYVVSIPSVSNLWTVLKGSGSARFTWAVFGICQSMLARPTSTAEADVQRRARVATRNADLNAKLESVCSEFASFAPGSGGCRYDNGAVFGTGFTAADVSTRDYFHPSVQGQKRLACVTWNAGYWQPLVKPIC